MTPIDNVYTKEEVNALIDAAVAEAKAIDEASMREHNFKATIISMILGFICLALFVDGLLEFGRLTKNEQVNIKQKCLSKGNSFQEVLSEASKLISGLSSHAGIVLAPKYQNNIKHID